MKREERVCKLENRRIETTNLKHWKENRFKKRRKEKRFRTRGIIKNVSSEPRRKELRGAGKILKGIMADNSSNFWEET